MWTFIADQNKNKNANYIVERTVQTKRGLQFTQGSSIQEKLFKFT